MDEVRKVRNRLLAESDWILNKDIPISSKSKGRFLKYRQELRDFMERENPTIETLPSAPEYEKAKPMRTMMDINRDFWGVNY